MADGRLHLSAVNLLAANLTDENAAELIEAAAGKRKREIERLLAQRFPKPDVKPMIRALPQRKSDRQLVPGRVEQNAAKVDAGQTGGMPLAARPSKLKPLAPKRYAIQATVDQATHDKLRHAQALLSHKLPSGDIAEVLDLALDALVSQLEKRKFAATSRPQANARRAAAKRTIPERVFGAGFMRDKRDAARRGRAQEAIAHA